MRRFKLVALLLTFMASTAWAQQQKTVTGKVSDATDGSPLPGVSIRIKGGDGVASTDANGSYSIMVEEGQTLIFTFIGVDSKEVLINEDTSIYDVSLEANEQILEEVAVTAFGVRRETKSLGFATQNVRAQEISDSQQPNIVNAIQGKVAGVQITNSGGSPGASSNILLRGGTSLSGNNQPLFVVDGIPIDNTTPLAQGGLSPTEAPATNRGMDINPEDIESLTVLKGPAAAALYGIRAASGAIVITTKKGSGEGRVSYSNLFSMDQVNRIPSFQSTFKQGEQGVFTPSTQLSWGSAFEPGEQVYNNFEDFFKTGFAHNHDLSVSGSTDRSSVYASAALYDQQGIVENTSFGRKSFRLTGETKVGEKLTVGGTANYVSSSRTYFSQGAGDNATGNIGSGVMGAVSWPRSDNMKDYLNPDGSQRELDPQGSDNPYWTINNKPINNKVDRIIATGNINYDPLSWLNFSYRAGTDYYVEQFQSITMPGTRIQLNQNGYIAEASTANQITTSTFLATANKSFNDFNISFTAGHNLEDTRRETMTATGRNFQDPSFPSINNVLANNRTVSKFLERRRIIGVFGDLNFDWKGIAFLNLRGRNDWSSTLPVNNQSFFYPAISTSIVVTDLLNELGSSINENVLSFAKIRGAWAQVGKDAPPQVLATTLGTYINDFTINPRGFIVNVNDFYGNPTLMPEFTNSFEIGTDLRFLKNKIGLDFTYYKTKSDNQILGTRTPPSSGSFLAYLNGGEIQNKGVEAILSVQAINRADFSWSAEVNFSANRATVNALPGLLDRVELSDAWAGLAQGAAFLNGTLFGINGRTWKRDEGGQLLLDNAGRPQVVSTLSLIGDRNPDWISGITNNFRYKSMSLTFMWDFRVGGDIYNATESSLVSTGLSTKTLDRGSMIFDGIIESTGEQSTIPVELDQDYYQTIHASNGAEFVEDGSWARLRYATFTYTLPKAFLSRIGVQNFQVLATGRNLLLFTNYSGVDPEVSGSGAGVGGSGSFGFDNLGVPATRGFDLGIKLTF